MTARKTAGGESQSWDAFWGEVSKGSTEVIRGVEVEVPTDMPLILEQRVAELQDSEREEDVAELVTLLFGTDCMTQWRDKGMGLREFQTVLTWGIAHAGGKKLSFGEALALVEKGEGAGKAPKEPNRAARRAQSTVTGGRSKRTSSASTASARARSRS